MKIVGNHTFIKYYTDTLIQQLNNSTEDLDTDVLRCIIQDGKNFLLETQQEIERWTLDMMLAKRSPSDFAGYIRGRQDRLEMNALRKRGLTRAVIDRGRKDIIDSILSTALDLAGGRLILNSDNHRNL